MKTPTELRQQAATELEDAETIAATAEAEGRSGMTEEESEKHDAHLAKCERLRREATDQERREKNRAALEAPQDTVSKPEIVQVREAGREFAQASLIPHGSLQAFKGEKAAVNAYRSGRWIHGILYGNAESRQWCRDHGVEARVASEGINAKGGFLVPDELSQAVIDLREEHGLARRECQIWPMSSDTLDIARIGDDMSAYFPNELVATTATDIGWEKVNLTAKELSALGLYSKSLAEDAIINIADQIASHMGLKFAEKEDNCLFNGDGTNTYGGIVGIRAKMVDGLHAGSYVASPGGDPTFVLQILATMTAVVAQCPIYALSGAKWYISQVGKSVCLDRLKYAQGGASGTDLQGDASLAEFMGFPVVVTNQMPTAQTTLNGLIAILFGNMRMAVALGNRRGFSMEVLRERYAEFRQDAIIGTERFDINAHDIGGAAGVHGPLSGIQFTT